MEPEPEQERSHISNYGTGTKIGLAPQPWILLFCHLIIWNNLANFSFLVAERSRMKTSKIINSEFYERARGPEGHPKR